VEISFKDSRVFHPVFEDSSVRSESCIAGIIIVVIVTSSSCKKHYIAINWIEYLFVFKSLQCILLLFGSVDEYLQKINAFREVGVERIHFWPISDFEEQIEIFRKQIVSAYH
jgi:hypothetical protein